MNQYLKIAIVLTIWFVGNFIIKKLFKFFIKRNLGIHVDFLSIAVRLVWAIVCIAFVAEMFTATKLLGQTLLTSSALLVAVAGFAAQQVLADIISGIMLSCSKPFDVGEKITITENNVTGIVESMSLRHTVIRTYQNSKLIIPNSVINKSIIENSNYENHFIGNFIEFAISYDSDLDKAIEIMENAIEENELVIDIREDKTIGKKVNVMVKDLGENGVVLKSTVRTKTIDDNFNACSEIRRRIKHEFDREGIKIYVKKFQIVDLDKTNEIPKIITD